MVAVDVLLLAGVVVVIVAAACAGSCGIVQCLLAGAWTGTALASHRSPLFEDYSKAKSLGTL